MNAYRITPLKYPWPTFFYIIAIAAAGALQRVVPLHLPDQRPMLLQSSGGLLATVGIYLVMMASIMLYRNRAVPISRRSTRLVIQGPFRYSRNPIYLGYTLLTIGAGIYVDNGWIMVTGIVAAAATHLYVIRKEEMHLLACFGYEFERYCRRTRVWL